MSATTTSRSAGAATPDEAACKPMRADAKRNRDALLAAATAAFTEHGTEASLEDVARRACVGIGTLYRHFPTREALVEAAYRQGVETLCDQADQLLAEQPPAVALEQWMVAFVGYVATKRGFASTLKQAADQNVELFAYVRGRIADAMRRLVEAAVASGQVRNDANPDDLLRALSGVCMVSDTAGWQAQSLRLVALMMDGLRYGAPTPA